MWPLSDSLSSLHNLFVWRGSCSTVLIITVVTMVFGKQGCHRKYLRWKRINQWGGYGGGTISTVFVQPIADGSAWEIHLKQVLFVQFIWMAEIRFTLKIIVCYFQERLPSLSQLCRKKQKQNLILIKKQSCVITEQLRIFQLWILHVQTTEKNLMWLAVRLHWETQEWFITIWPETDSPPHYH